MAERRMFTKKITDSDAFTTLPPTTQALYFHLCMNADDDGFNNKIRQAMFNAHADQNDLNLLVQHRFVIPFDEKGVVVIKHWRLHNIIRADRYHKTEYVEEMEKLILKDNGVYTDYDNQTETNGIPDGNQVTTTWQPDDNQTETEVSIGKVSIGKVSIGKDTEEQPAPEKPPKPSKHKYGEYKHILLTDEEYMKLLKEYGEDETVKAIEFFDAYIEEKGYKGKSHYLAMRRWVFNAVAEQEQRKVKTQVGGNITNKVAQQLDNFYNMADEWAKSYAEG